MSKIKLCIKESRCIKCRLCEKVCPTGAMKFIGDNAINTKRVYDETKCFRCGLCQDVCPKNVFVFSDKSEGDNFTKSKVPDFSENPERFPKIKNFNTQIQSIEHISPKVIKLVVRILGKEPFIFIAGQYADIYFDKEFVRPYSISSPPIESLRGNLVEFTVEVVDNGLGSKSLLSLKVGQKIKISGPYGAMVLEENMDNETPFVFIATGTGIAPFKSMINQLLLTQHQNAIHLIFGVRNEESIFYQEHFAWLRSLYPNFTFEFCLSQASNEWGGFKGRVTDYFEKYQVTNSGTRFYICGLSPMINSIKEIFQKRGLSFKYVYYEQFD